ncbi:hypothetical protein F5884DRAFT_675550 [Xylogone sp. PMI_703]|nr:hypothetical protein F5884DRAFT_675550 [Xylogone sp. PMI_703]
MASRQNHRQFVITIALCIIAWGVKATGVENTDTNPDLHCAPTRWYNVLVFFLTNYAIHAATVKALPGECGWTSAAYKACCLLVPYAGVRRGLNIFLRASALADTSLHQATLANALCMVVRSKDWRPLNGEVVQGCSYAYKERDEEEEKKKEKKKNCDVEKSPIRVSTISTTSSTSSAGGSPVEVNWRVEAPYEDCGAKTKTMQCFEFLLYSYRFRPMPLQNQVINPKDVEVHGLCKLPPGYTLCIVPPHMHVRPKSDAHEKIELSSNFSALQVLWSIAQTIIGCYTLYSARGSQLKQYGYGAFGLTVIPYVIASIVNLLGGLVTRDYNFMNSCQKAKLSPGHTITVPSHGPFQRLPPYKFERIFKFTSVILLVAAVIAPYILIYVMTGYKPQQATNTQLNFTTHWLCLGQVYGLSVTEFERHPRKKTWATVLFIVLVCYSWAAIGGLVIVTQEMMEFGTCQTL